MCIPSKKSNAQTLEHATRTSNLEFSILATLKGFSFERLKAMIQSVSPDAQCLFIQTLLKRLG